MFKVSDLRASYERAAGIEPSAPPNLDEIESVLRAAWPPIPIDARNAFAQRGRLYCDASEYQRQMHHQSWVDLDPAYFARRTDGLSFLSTPELVAVLPLYLQLLVALGPTSPVRDTRSARANAAHTT